MKKENTSDGEVLEGNNRYEGYIVDLMESVAAVANNSYGLSEFLL